MISTRRLLELCRTGGAVALELAGRVRREIKSDRSVVTEADRAVERRLREDALAIAPGLGVLGEELSFVEGDGEWSLAIDPIDGTASYVDGLPTWAITVAICRDALPIRGVVFLPALGEWYAAGDDTEGLISNVSLGDPPDPDDRIDRDTRLLVHSRAHRYVHPDFPGKLRSLGSLAYHLALVARGAARGAFLGRARFWDWAAGSVLLGAVGGEVVDLEGTPADPRAHFGSDPAPIPLVAGVRPGPICACFSDAR